MFLECGGSTPLSPCEKRTKAPSRRRIPKLPHQQLRALVGEVADNNQCAGQNDGSVTANQTNLHVAERATEIDNRPTQRVQESINDAEVKNLPEAFARGYLDRIDNGRSEEHTSELQSH